MTESEHSHPELYDVRINDVGEVEVFDGTAWIPYRRVSADDPGPLVRQDVPRLWDDIR